MEALERNSTCIARRCGMPLRRVLAVSRFFPIGFEVTFKME